jgi:ubiquitin-activating enzyme E1
MAEPDALELDEGLYSRALLALGHEAMSRMSKASVLILGAGGLGVEIAKNVILAGFKKVTIHDESPVSLSDLASQFYLSESDVGQNRALTSLPRLVQLNEYVTVSAHSDKLTDDFVLQYNCFVVTIPLPESALLAYGKLCHAWGIKFIVTVTRGVFGMLFNDFGDNFVVVEPTFEKPSRSLIEDISNDERGGVVKVNDKDKHNLSVGDYVRFEEVEGMVELNGREWPVTQVINAVSFRISDTSQFGQYKAVNSNGYANQIIPPREMHFKELSAGLADPIVDVFDFGAFGRDQQVLLAFWSLFRALEVGGSFPAVADSVNSEFHWVDPIDGDLLKEFWLEDAVIAPTAAIFGGIAAQEVIKSISGKFGPFPGFLCAGNVEALPADRLFEAKGDRYDPYRLVFGNAQQEAMMNLRYFLVGAGAIGCEILKNWALMGLSAGPRGSIVVTDMDLIERSNLSRQFLFRNDDIGHPKSVCAAAAVSRMNAELKIKADQNRVGPETEHIYTAEFHQSLDGTCNALDNVEARLYNNNQCVFFRKPLLESGTMGPMAHFETIIPDLTESYESNKDPPTQGIPQCTLHSFPSNITHCAMWAREQFFNLFTRAPGIANQYLSDQSYVKKMMKADRGGLYENLLLIEKILVTERPQTFQDCVVWARLRFEDLFNFGIRNLVFSYPPDLEKDGHRFWTGTRRLPARLVYDPMNEQHVSFITATARLRADVFGIQVGPEAAPRAADVAVPEWVPEKLEVETEEGDKVKKKQVRGTNQEMDRICKLIRPLRDSPPVITSLEFEKDDATNGHIDFIAAAANLRAVNYRIEQASKFDIKSIAGNIIPALATTTAMICGFVCLEMYKMHSAVRKPIEAFRSGFINLAVPSITLTVPNKCREVVCAGNGLKYTLWDRWVIEGDLTVHQFVEAIKQKFGLDIDNLLIGSECV